MSSKPSKSGAVKTDLDKEGPASKDAQASGQTASDHPITPSRD